VYRLPIAYGLAVAGICSAILATKEVGLDELRAVIRATAFTSSIPFLAAFLASPLHRLRPSLASRWLMANRRYVGLSVASSHLWHLAAIITLVTVSDDARAKVQTTTLVFGGLGFVLLALMAATSNDASQRALGRWWGVLHATGLYVVWLDFIFTYVGTAPSSPFHAVMTLAFAAAFAMRMAAPWASRAPVRA
jgi:DMSO/TMAO reductase YedYZ heme-binding membrane subunit